MSRTFIANIFSLILMTSCNLEWNEMTEYMDRNGADVKPVLEDVFRLSEIMKSNPERPEQATGLDEISLMDNFGTIPEYSLHYLADLSMNLPNIENLEEDWAVQNENLAMYDPDDLDIEVVTGFQWLRALVWYLDRSLLPADLRSYYQLYFKDMETLEENYTKIRDLEYVMVIRTIEYRNPVLHEGLWGYDSYDKGYYAGEGYIFDLMSGELLLVLDFSAGSSDSVEYSQKDYDGAVRALKRDMEINAEKALRAALFEAIPGIDSL